MIIYNVTVTLNENIHSRWVEWIRHEHIPEVLSTRLFKKAVLSRIISDKELSVSPNEVEDFIKDALAKNESQKAEIERFYKKESNKNKLSDDLLDQKIIDMLKEHSKIKEKNQKTSELQGAQPNL